MTPFLIAAALLAVVAAAALTRPLWRRASAEDTATESPDITRLRTQLEQLKSLHAGGALGDEAYAQARGPLEQRLVELVTQSPPAAPAVAPSGASTRRLASLLSVVVVGVAAGGYAWLGNPAALQASAVAAGPAGSGDAGAGAPGASHSVTREQIEAMVDRLAERLKERPDDADGWFMLARSHAVLGQHEKSLPAFKRAVELRADDPTLLADYADALAVVNGRSLEGEPAKLIERALKIDPRQLKALSLAGTLAFDRQDFAGAIRHWEQMLAIAPDSDMTRQIQSGIDEARRRLGGAPVAAAPSARPAAPLAAPPVRDAQGTAPALSAVSGTVTLSRALAAQAAPDDTVFVFARPAEGSRMPLAILRKQVRDLPLKFTLDDSLAMSPAATLSSAQRVVVGARISKSGNAMTQPGDLQGFSAPVAPGASGLAIEIAEVVGR